MIAPPSWAAAGSLSTAPPFPCLLPATALASLLLPVPVSEEMLWHGHSRVVWELASSPAFFRKIVRFLVTAFVLNGLFMAPNTCTTGLLRIICHLQERICA
ncbi:MAG: hypothetical protein M1442_04175 [Candidatus Thermoplasmatota archaeon]|nr:hypothetical protein [Candidatus Thermoplasmatota archaeon]